jgi:predicted Zn-dependent protease
VASKRKKKSKKHPLQHVQVSNLVMRKLDEAFELMEARRWNEAAKLLYDLDRRHPRTAEVLGVRLELAVRTNDFGLAEELSERLVEVRPNDAKLRLSLAGARLANGHPALSLEAVREYFNRWPDHASADKAREMAAAVEADLVERLHSLNLDGPEGERLAGMHERVHQFVTQGKLIAARRAAEQLLAERPKFVPALNNASELYAQDGDYGNAINFCQRALEVESGNVHARGNLVRYLFLSGRHDEGRAQAEGLKVLQPIGVERWVKIAESLSVLGDNAGVLATASAAKEKGRLPAGEETALLEHLAGVAAFRLGQETEARGHWKEALRHRPGFDLAQDNLDDLRRPVAEREGPWPFSLAHWIPRRVIEALAGRIESVKGRDKDEAIRREVQRFLEERPGRTALVPVLLDRGDSAARGWALMVARLLRTPAILAAVRDFVVGQRGPDKARLEASDLALEAGLLSGGMTRMWVDGEWREVLLWGVELTDEPSHNHSAKVVRLATDGHTVLMGGDGERAEDLFRQALALEPDAPDLVNNLAAALQEQGRDAETEALQRDNHARHPDYFFGRIGFARLAVRDNRLDEASALLDPLMTRKRLHYSEFVALAISQIELALARGLKDGARSWLEMWERMLPDHPQLPTLRRRVNSGSWLGLLGPRT